MIKSKIYYISLEDNVSIIDEFKHIQVSEKCFDIMLPKYKLSRFYIRNIDHRAANILKQEALSNNCEAAISYKTYTMQPDRTDVLLTGNNKNLYSVIAKLHVQPFSLPEIAKDLEYILNNKTKTARNSEEDLLTIGKKQFYPFTDNYIMGIINCTPDSFFENSRVNEKNLSKKVEEYLQNGVHILDVGGESTRPGAESVACEEERNRVIPVIQFISSHYDIPISIDTYKASIADEAIQNGASMINDISALRFDDKMADVVRDNNVPVCLMHMKGDPKTMQDNPYYDNTIDEIFDFFQERMHYSMARGIPERNIILDPGIGFGKRIQDNLRIIKYLSCFTTLGRPLLIGASRKGFLGHITSKPIEERLTANIAVHLIAVQNGASFVRIHDSLISDALKIMNSIKETCRFES